MKQKVTKDLTPRSPATVKGGRADLAGTNDNITLVRAARHPGT